MLTRKRIFYVVTVCAVAVAAYFFFALEQPPKLTVSFLNVGDGDAILIRAPSGTTLLVDGGPDTSILRALGNALPFWQRHIDAVFETNAATGSVGGLPDVFSRYRVSHFVHPATLSDSRTEAVVLASAASSTASVSTFHRGLRFDLGDGAYMDTLLPYAGADTVALRLVYGNTAFFVSGALSEKEMKELETLDAKDGELQTDVLFVPHEGADGAVTIDFLEALNPTNAVISVGAQNRYGYPATSTFAVLKDAGIQVVRTDEQGTVTFVSDGRTVTRK